VYHQNEVEQSKYNFELADTTVLLRRFDEHEAEFTRLIEAKLALPAYEQVMKASHTFNLLDARKAISVTERQRYILRVRTMARAVAQAYYDSREALGFPMLRDRRFDAGRDLRMSARDFLVEIGTEELPPLALPELEAAFAEGIRKGLGEAALSHGEVRSFATPRRLAVLVRDLADMQQVQSIKLKGPPVSAAFGKDGAPTPAALKFAEKCGVDVGGLKRVTEGKGEFLFFEGSKPGQKTGGLLAGIVQRSLDQLPIPKRMHWGASTAEFVRPVHWLVMLQGLGNDPRAPARHRLG
jgi:hypothetical protein